MLGLLAEMANYFPWLGQNHDPPNLYFPSSWDSGVSHNIWSNTILKISPFQLLCKSILIVTFFLIVGHSDYFYWCYEYITMQSFFLQRTLWINIISLRVWKWNVWVTSYLFLSILLKQSINSWYFLVRVTIKWDHLIEQQLWFCATE
jgi:hypothetical protein